MVILKVERTFMHGLENTIVINSSVEELKPFSEVLIIKSNGTARQFRLIMNSTVPIGYVLIGDAESRMCRLHLGHKYHVEGIKSSIIVQKTPSVDFSQMKIAGYSSVIEEIIERVFRPRKLSAECRKKFNTQFSRGVILYGPPGTGKTMLVRELCEYFNLKVKVVDGSQLLHSSIAKSEEAVRVLFDDAVTDQRNKGDLSPLHVLVFDDMDSLFSKRTSSKGGSVTRNSVVNHLLSMMDRYKSLNNILFFGTTNRWDMLDPAVFRRGRFEIQVKLDLPTVQERLEILKYHLDDLQKNGFLSPDISTAKLQQLANATDKYSGANIGGIVQLAFSQATSRIFTRTITDLQTLNPEELVNIRVEWSDMTTAFYRYKQMRQEVENEYNKRK